jgi:hypothetical protein
LLIVLPPSFAGGQGQEPLGFGGARALSGGCVFGLLLGGVGDGAERLAALVVRGVIVLEDCSTNSLPLSDSTSVSSAWASGPPMAPQCAPPVAGYAVARIVSRARTCCGSPQSAPTVSPLSRQCVAPPGFLCVLSVIRE